MKQKNRVKIILFILLLFIFSITWFELPNQSLAADPIMEDWDTMKGKADAFITQGKDQGGATIFSSQDLKDLVLPIARTLVAAATVIVTIVTIIIGIQYMMASPESKAKLKQKLIGLVISVVVIYGAQGIWAILYNFMSKVTID